MKNKEPFTFIPHIGMSLTDAKAWGTQNGATPYLPKDNKCECCLMARGELYVQHRSLEHATIGSWECIWCFHYTDLQYMHCASKRREVDSLIKGYHFFGIEDSIPICKWCKQNWFELGNVNQPCVNAPKAPFVEALEPEDESIDVKDQPVIDFGNPEDSSEDGIAITY